jgi:hypothetical protein
MSKAIELRMSALEKRLAALEKKGKPSQAWRAHIGWAKDDPLYDKAMKLGAAYRKRQK